MAKQGGGVYKLKRRYQFNRCAQLSVLYLVLTKMSVEANAYGTVVIAFYMGSFFVPLTAFIDFTSILVDVIMVTNAKPTSYITMIFVPLVYSAVFFFCMMHDHIACTRSKRNFLFKLKARMIDFHTYSIVFIIP